MKRRSASSSCSSSSSSSCIGPPIPNNDHIHEPNNKSVQPKKPKRVRAKKINNLTNAPANSATSPKSRSSIYRGVTRWTGRFEAHLWDKTTWNSIQNKKGRQRAYDNEEDAARTYDLAALKYWGPATILNFPVESYAKEIEEMQKLTNEEYLASLRRRSSGFSRGVSKFRGVARHHHNGRWEARIGRVSGNKYLYLGTYSTQEEAAVAYDMAAIEFRGPNAVTNFDISNYADKFNKILPELQQSKHQQVQPEEETNPDYFNKVLADEVQDENREVQLVSIPKFESIHHIDSQAMIMMDPTEEHEHPWDLCLDTDFDSLPLPDIVPLEKASDVLGWLDDEGFEDNIECIFDGQFYDNEFLLQDAMSGTGTGCKLDSDITASREMNGQDLSTSHSSSSLSTMASFCSNI
ncbi:hypothetical protein DH2020_023618 [Rehmannia glutinosa]|uniref:AP2/ERF domain-containing protein n=1 Tax=Rehmannia glutinosa TaxID=99300 RepID=A0ABR0W7Z7_REHGL